MSRRWTLLAAVIGLLVSNTALYSQVSRSGLLSPTALRRAGLTRSWFTQIDVDRSIGRVAHITQHISTSRLQWIYQVVSEGGRVNVSEFQLDKFGKPLGRAGAAEQAAERIIAIVDAKQSRMSGEDAMADELTAIKQAAEQVVQNVVDHRKKPPAEDAPVADAEKDLVVPLLQRVKANPDLYPQLVQRIVPQITFYVATDQGVVHAIDGESGETRWSVPVGRPEHPNMEPAANESYVALINGSQLYVVDSQTGKFIWQRRLRSAPGAGPALVGDLVFIPMVDGIVESFDLGLFNEREVVDDEENIRGRYQPPKYFTSIGRSMVQPLATPNGSITWPTDRGYLYVMDGPQMQPRYRVVSTQTIVARPSFLAPNMLFVSSIDGYVHCIHEKSGSIIWPFSTGEPISQTPVPIGDSVFVVTDDGNLFCIAAQDRHELWPIVSHVKQFLAASQTRIYVIADTGRLLVLDRNTGGRITSIDLGELDVKFVNMQTDRLILGTKTGLIQCLHEPDSVLPVLHAEDEQNLQASQQRKPVAAKPKADPGAEKPAGADPFAPKAADPFGGGASDPFGGGGSDPFGGGGSDPFGGGGSDPFGGG